MKIKEQKKTNQIFSLFYVCKICVKFQYKYVVVFAR